MTLTSFLNAVQVLCIALVNEEQGANGGDVPYSAHSDRSQALMIKLPF